MRQKTAQAIKSVIGILAPIETIRWTLKNIGLPLLPFGFGALIRGFYSNRFDAEVFDPAHITFSLAILCLLVCVSAAKLSDEKQRDVFMMLFGVVALLFVVVFSLVTWIQYDQDSRLLLFYTSMDSSIKNSSYDAQMTLSMLSKGNVSDNTRIIGALRDFSFRLGGITILLALVCKYAYKLGD